ncbi:MAG TPA: hypothetical protein ENN81_05055 [Phycisphaerales bacterium]|nr:hypothetical protein [Phycisphaerales bacterium]
MAGLLLKFLIFNNGKVYDDFKLCGAYMFGTDGVGVRRAKITCTGGVVECRKSNLETAGLALLWPVEGFGKVLLATTCLPERKRPYILNLEIARAKLMQITARREDWSFFSGFGDLEGAVSEAQGHFIKALQNLDNPAKASLPADEALQKAVMVGEKLALKQALTSLDSRRKSHALGKGCLGCRFDPARIGDTAYMEHLLGLFGYVTIPVNWGQIEPTRGQYDFSSVDACVEALANRRVVMGAGPLLRFSKDYLPAWLVGSKTSFEKVREAAYQFVTRMVTRYAAVVRVWYAVSGLNVFNHFGLSFEQILEMTRAATLAVRTASGRAIKVIEIGNPWGEYYAIVPGSIPPLVYMDMVVQSGINFDAFALQMRFGRNQSGMHVRDFLQVSSLLDSFAPISKPLYITDVEIPGVEGDGLFAPDAAGSWRGGWNETHQQQWIEQFYRIALSKPFVDAVSYANLADRSDSLTPQSGLLTTPLEPKRSYAALKKLQGVLFGGA